MLENNARICDLVLYADLHEIKVHSVENFCIGNYDIFEIGFVLKDRKEQEKLSDFISSCSNKFILWKVQGFEDNKKLVQFIAKGGENESN